MSDPLARYPVLLEFRASVRRPRLLMSGNVIELFLDKQGPYADAALALGQAKYHDAEVAVTLRLMKHPDGRDAAVEAPVEPDEWNEALDAAIATVSAMSREQLLEVGAAAVIGCLKR